MTAPAVVAWAARLGLNCASPTLRWLLWVRWAVIIFTVAALGEFVADPACPEQPPRTAAFPLTTRIVVGLLTGAKRCGGKAGSCCGSVCWVGR